MTRTEIRAARLRIVQLRTEADRETRAAARAELLLTARTIEQRVERAEARRAA